MAPVERVRFGHAIVHTQVFTGQGTHYDDQQSYEQQIHSETLPLRFLAADKRADEQTRRQPRSRDPEQTDLKMPRSRDAVWKELRKRYSIQTVALDSIVSGHRPG